MNKLHLLALVIFFIFIIPLVISEQVQQDCRTDQDCIDKGLTNYFCNQTTGLCQPKQDIQQTSGNYIVVPSTETPEPIATQSPTVIPTEQGCTDSDNGKNYYKQGSVTVILGEGYDIGYPDLCLDKNTLMEYYCKDSTIGNEKYDCSKEGKMCIDNRCSNGTDTNEEDKFYILDKTELDFPDINYQQTVDGIYTGVDPYVYKFRNTVRYTDPNFYSNPDEWRKISIYDPIMIYFYVFHSDKESTVWAEYELEVNPPGSYTPKKTHKIPCELHEEKENGNVWKCTTTGLSLLNWGLESIISGLDVSLQGSVINSLVKVTDDKDNKLEAKSPKIVVAKWVFNVITEDGDFSNSETILYSIVERVNFFVDFSNSQNGLVKAYQDSVQYPHASYKIVYYKDMISFTGPLSYKNIVIPNSFIQRGVPIIVSDSILSNNNGFEQTNEIIVKTSAFVSGGVLYDKKSNTIEVEAHEIGHVFDLCDEYSLFTYVVQDSYAKLSHFSRSERSEVSRLLSSVTSGDEGLGFYTQEDLEKIQKARDIINGLPGGCPNPFPPCCESEVTPYCGFPERCKGMPKNYPPDVDWPHSIMSDNHFHHDRAALFLWYPQGSVCPLKDCR